MWSKNAFTILLHVATITLLLTSYVHAENADLVLSTKQLPSGGQVLIVRTADRPAAEFAALASDQGKDRFRVTSYYAISVELLAPSKPPLVFASWIVPIQAGIKSWQPEVLDLRIDDREITFAYTLNGDLCVAQAALVGIGSSAHETYIGDWTDTAQARPFTSKDVLVSLGRDKDNLLTLAATDHRFETGPTTHKFRQLKGKFEFERVD